MGQIIDINSIAFKVVGVFQDEGGDNEERYIYIPYTTRQRIEGGTDKLDQINTTFRPELDIRGGLLLKKA